MGSNHSHPVDVDPQAVHHAEKSWKNFTLAMKIGIAHVVVILLLMAFFLV